MLGQTRLASGRFEALDALRGICALLVVLFHIPIYHALKDVGAFANLQFCDLVTFHNDEKLVLLGTPDQAVLPALLLSVVLVVPVAALTYRWIEKPAMDAARSGLSTKRAAAPGFGRPARWLRAISGRRVAPHRPA